MKPGVEVLDDAPGLGPLVEKKVFYDFRLRMWLSRGDPIRWSQPWGLYDRGRLEDDGTTLFTSLRVDREYMFAGLFYGVEGMRVGGTRRIRVAPSGQPSNATTLAGQQPVNPPGYTALLFG